MLRAIRGATTAPANETEAILTSVRELLSRMLAVNEIGADHLVCAFFSATPDLDAVFPARAAREIGWGDVPLFGMQELAVRGAPERCLRVMLLVQQPPGAEPPAATEHVYLRGAQSLRPDLVSPSGGSSSPDGLVTSLFGGTFTFYYA